MYNQTKGKDARWRMVVDMKKIEVYGLGEVEVSENEAVKIEVPSEYEEIYVTTSGIVVGYDEAFCGYVQLGVNQ